jgi:hypothetical protein
LPTRASVEATKLGELSVFLRGLDSTWTDADAQRRLADKVGSAARPANEVRFYTLRLVVFAADIHDEVMRWECEIGRQPIGVTAQAVGKTLTWGDGNPQSTYSVIVLAAGMAWGLVEDHPTAMRTLRHELVHVWGNLVDLHISGPGEAGIASNDWPGIKRYWARSVGEEFDAEHYAYTEVPDDAASLEDNVFTVGVWSRAVEAVADAVRRHQVTHDDLQDVWEAVLGLGDPLLQIGRHLGRLDAHRSERAVAEFLAQLPSVSRAGIALLARALVDRDEAGEANALEDAFEMVVVAAGVQPVQDSEGVRLIVRDPDSET